MKIFISADIEGIGGVATWDQAKADGADYARARQWMTEDVNAAIEGAIDAGADEVWVRDAHERARNILWESLHPRARLISGWAPTIDMVQGLDASSELLFLVGYHPGPSTPGGVLSHTFSSRIIDLRLNDQPCNEAVIAAVQAGMYGVPVGLVTGQAELWDEIRPSLPQTRFVATKRGIAYQAALLEPMGEVRRRIHEEAHAAVTHRITGEGPQPFRPEPPLRIEMELRTLEAALALESVEGVERVSAGGILISAGDGATLIRRFFGALQVLYSVRDAG
jgi:D-amino peptidase